MYAYCGYSLPLVIVLNVDYLLKQKSGHDIQPLAMVFFVAVSLHYVNRPFRYKNAAANGYVKELFKINCCGVILPAWIQV